MLQKSLQQVNASLNLTRNDIETHFQKEVTKLLYAYAKYTEQQSLPTHV